MRDVPRTDMISAAIQTIYSEASKHSIVGYQHAILEWLKEHIDHDAAGWLILSEDLTINQACLINITEQTLGKLQERFQDKETLVIAIQASGSRVIIQPGELDRQSGSSMEHMLQLSLFGLSEKNQNKTRHLITLQRTNKNLPFNEHDRLFLSMIIDHIISAWNICCTLNTLYHIHRKTALALNTALSDNYGVLHLASEEFRYTLKKEWPHWNNHQLPSELSLWIHENPTPSKRIYVGSKIQIQSTWYNGLLLLHASDINPISTLTTHEYHIMQMYCDGLTYKEISEKLNLAPSTIRNHISKSYIRLG
ncbi:MAG: LuxR C-terminal-related transcriptional regulator, partial [Gammaproteobacteria bacterium]|nr:LuxR C-terminal-related transcriptional regulator [Gammaproteobacteria bacterium]